MRFVIWSVIGAVSLAVPALAAVADSDACAHFAWDVSHELAVMQQTAKQVVAATKVGSGVPHLEIDKLYELKLAPQGSVTFAAQPGKSLPAAGAQGGLVSFRVAKAGLYRVSITTGHWIDVVAGDQLVKSKDFQGSHTCSRPHKIVEFELPAGAQLTLQLSGGTDSAVTVAITPVKG
jgi:hypothetical protein